MHHSPPLTSPHRVVLEQNIVGAQGVRLLGYNRNFSASCAIAPHTHGSLFELVYVVSGEIRFEADGRCDVLHGGDMYLTQPGQPHSTGASPTGVCEFYWLHLDARCSTCLGLNTRTARTLFAALHGVRGCALHGNARWDKALGGLLRTLTQEPAREMPDALALQTACVLLPILHDAMHRSTAAEGCTQDIEAAVHFVRSSVCDVLPLAALARAAQLSVARFKIKFMQQVGVPPRTFVNLTKIEAAKQMLLAGESVTDTAFGLSFSSSSYFSTQFKQFTGQSPTQFVQNNLAQARAAQEGSRQDEAMDAI